MSQNRTRLGDQAKGHCSSSHNQCASQAQTQLKKSHEKKNKSEIVTFSPLSVGFALSPKKLHSCLGYLLVRGSWFLHSFLLSFHPSVTYLFNYQIFIEHTLRLMCTRIPMLGEREKCVTNFAIC